MVGESLGWLLDLLFWRIRATSCGRVWAALMVGPCDDESRKFCLGFCFFCEERFSRELSGCRFSQGVNRMRVHLNEDLCLEANSGSQPDAGSPGVSTGCWFTQVTRVLRLTHSADASSRNPRRVVPMGTGPPLHVHAGRGQSLR